MICRRRTMKLARLTVCCALVRKAIELANIKPE
jgi:hypothetical protein